MAIFRLARRFVIVVGVFLQISFTERALATAMDGGKLSSVNQTTVEKLVKEVVGYKHPVVFVDFDNTIYMKKDLKLLEGEIDKVIIMKSLIEARDSVTGSNVAEASRYLVEQATALEKDRFKNLSDVKKGYIGDSGFRNNLTERIARDFTNRAKPNHRVSYLLNLGFSSNYLEKVYTEMSKNYQEYYEGIRPNLTIVEFICQLVRLKVPVFILTDNSEANVMVGFRHMNLDNYIRNRVSELGRKIDQKIPIVAPETDIHGVIPVNLDEKPIIPIISFLKLRPGASYPNQFETGSKRSPEILVTIKEILERKHGIDLNRGTTYVLFDDSDEIVDIFVSKGCKGYLVDGDNIHLYKKK
ncbi:MAG: hypothetical protein LBB13_01970 [Rickettsiales bacterium]|jgi:phosphoglycolate phosphatase-like HAD superfamily hydrolase|nr:hypothetical protein [Rickettsiales bacterium]